MNKRCFRIVVVAAIWVLATATLGWADTMFNVSINTTPLMGNTSGPFSIDFQLIDGSSTGILGDANNSASITNFAFGGGGAPFGTANLTGAAGGDLSSVVSLTDNFFFNDFQQSFTAGSTLSFTVDLTTNLDPGPTPDAFTFAILDNTGAQITTSDPSGGNSLVSVNINSSSPTVTTSTGTGRYAALKVISTPVPTPEPGSFSLLITGMAALVGLGVWKKGLPG
jgi:hypothetical protein